MTDPEQPTDGVPTGRGDDMEAAAGDVIMPAGGPTDDGVGDAVDVSTLISTLERRTQRPARVLVLVVVVGAVVLVLALVFGIIP